MYIELTNACNMACDHCCMSAVSPKSRKARFMSREVIAAACKLAADYQEPITLGGGEPTLHPDFPYAFGLAILSAAYDAPLMVITNGSNRDITTNMLYLSKTAENVFRCEVSKDAYHDARIVHPQVYEIAARQKMIRNTMHNIIAKGRGRNLSSTVQCACDTIHISVDGSIHRCGCRRKADYVGNVLDTTLNLEAADAFGYECNGRRSVRP